MSDEAGKGRPDAGRPSSQEAPWWPLDRALEAYRSGDERAVVLMRTDVGGEEEVEVSLFFRTPAEMGPVERTAMASARGRVLDLGSGPGAHAIPLQQAGCRVTAAEVLPRAREALREAGVADVRAGGLETLAPEERFDTILVLMNGAGLAGSLEGLGPFLLRMAGHLAEGGAILADSTDPLAWDDPVDGRYPGEVHMQLGFEGAWGPPFPFLFVDADTLVRTAEAHGLSAEVACREEDGRYLARISRGPRPSAP